MELALTSAYKKNFHKTNVKVLINRETGIPSFCAEYPMDCVVKGIGKIMESPSKYKYALSEEPRYI